MNTPKTLFYFRTHFDDAANLGVVNKCRAMARSAPGGSDALYFTQKGICLNDTVIYPFLHQKRSARHFWLYYVLADRFLARYIPFEQYDTFYIRHLPAHPLFIYLLYVAQKRHPRLRIIVEFPTWPYDAELKGWKQRPVAWLDRWWRGKMSAYVDFYCHYGVETEVLGRKAVPMCNGIEVAKTPVRSVVPVKEKGRLRLLAIGSWSAWHGLDRLIKGMAAYQSTQPDCRVELTIAGEGPALAAWKQQVAAEGIGGQVRFLPPVSGAALDALFQAADVAVGSLALHRIGLYAASPLKHREYGARGIPFLFSGHDGDFPAHLPFVFVCPPDESPVDVAALVDFFQRRIQPETTTADMRLYAENHLDWRPKMAKLYFDSAQ